MTVDNLASGFIKRISLSVILICQTFYFAASGQNDSITIKAAITAYNQFKLKESRVIFEKIAKSSDAPVFDRAEAMYNLGLQDWKIFRNYSASEQRLQSCLLLNCQKARSYILLGQINLEASPFSRAMLFANKAIEMSNNETDKLNSFLLKAQIVYSENLILIKKDLLPDTENLLLASKELKYILARQPGRPAPAELLLGISLSLKNGPDALMQLDLLKDQQLREICMSADPLSAKLETTKN